MKFYGATAALLLVWLGALVWGGAAAPVDQWISSALYLGEGASAAPVWVVVTELGGWKILLGIALLAWLYLMMGRRTRDALFLLGMVIGVRALVEGQKLIFARPRPEVAHLAEVSSYSFPSGHSANALATYLTLGLIFSARLPVMIVLAVLVGFIGLSRVVLGVHWPSDVIGGWALAALCLVVARRNWRTAGHGK